MQDNEINTPNQRKGSSDPRAKYGPFVEGYIHWEAEGLRSGETG